MKKEACTYDTTAQFTAFISSGNAFYDRDTLNVFSAVKLVFVCWRYVFTFYVGDSSVTYQLKYIASSLVTYVFITT